MTLYLLLPPRSPSPLAESLGLLSNALCEQGLKARCIRLPAAPAKRLLILRRILRRENARGIVSFDERDHLLLAAVCPGAERRAIFMQTTLPGWRREPANRWFWRFLPWLARRGVLAAPNKPLCRLLGERVGGGLQVLHLPLPAPVFAKEPAVPAIDLKKRPPLIVFAAPLERTMQPGLAVRALSLMHWPQVRLLMPRQGTSFRAMRHMVEQLGLTRQVMFTTDDPLSHLDRARVACVPARIDPFAHGVVAALAHGLPVVAAPTPAARDILEATPQLGALVEMTDAEAWASAFRLWLEEPGDALTRLHHVHRFTPRQTARHWRERLFP